MLAAALLALSLLSTTGCGDDASPSSVPDAAAAGDAMPAPDAAPPDADPGAPDAGSRICGGFANTQCNDTEYCDYTDNECGGGEGAGTCKPRPEVCQPAQMPVCGCDGRSYTNECEAYRQGTDKSSAAGC